MSDSARRGAATGATDTKSRGRGRTSQPSTTTSEARDKGAFEFKQQSGDESIPELLRRLADQGSHLAKQQAKLVEAEVRSSVNDIKMAAGAMAGAAVVGIAGLGVLLMGLSFLLGEFMALWLATLIVAAATLLGAYALYEGGLKKLQSSSLDVERTRRTLERAPDAISGNTSEGPNDAR